MNRISTFALLVAAITACGGDRAGGVTAPLPTRPQAALVLAAPPGPLVPTSSIRLHTTQGDGGDGTAALPVSWSSTREDVATVSAEGVVTGVSPGEAEIVAATDVDTVRTTVTVSDGGLLTAEPTTISAFAGAVTLFAPAGAGEAGTAISVRAVEAPSTADVLVTGTTYEVGPGTLALAQPIVLTIRYAPWRIPADVWEPGVRIVTLTAAGWLPVAGSTADAAEHAVSAPVSRAGTYAVLIPPQVARVRLASEALSVLAGSSSPLGVTVIGVDDAELHGVIVTWSTTNPAIARVETDGTVAALTPGRTTVFADAGGRRAQATLTVLPPGPLVLSPGHLQMSLGGPSAGMVAYDRRFGLLASASVDWVSADSAVARPDAEGRVHVRGPGTTWIRGTIGALRDSVRVVVTGEPVASLTIIAPRTLLSVQSSLTLGAVVRDAAGQPLTGRVLEWSSSDPSVATVSSSGMVSGLARGRATISVASEGRVGTVDIDVEDGVVGPIIVSPGQMTIPQGVPHRAVVYDGRLQVADGRLFAWTSSDARVATTLPDGQVVGHARGTVWVKATTRGWSDSVRVTVTGAPRGPLIISPGSLLLGLTDVVNVVVYDGTFNILPNAELTWSSTDESVARVDAAGVVRARAAGTVRVSASIGALRDSIVVVVRSPVASVAIEVVQPVITAGRSGCFIATPYDGASNPAFGQTVAWSSSNPAVATVTSRGVVTGVAPGTASITATSVDKHASVDVTIAPQPAPPPPALAFSNEPAGMRMLSDNPWDLLGMDCWEHANRGAHSAVVADATAPRSPGGVLEHVYPAGFVGGNEPAIDQFVLRERPREVFAGTFFKFNAEWQGHASGANKMINFLSPDAQQRWWLMLRAVGERDDNADLSDGPYFVDAVFCNRFGGLPGTNRNAEPVSVGEWHKLEWYMRGNSPGQSDGVIRWWVDDVLRGEYTGLDCLGSSFDWMEIAPTFGGTDGVKGRSDFVRFDHTYISGR